MRKTRLMTATALILASLMIFTTGVFAEETGPTEPEKVSVDTALERLDTLCKALEGKYFTVNEKACGYGLSNHGCSNCYNRNVIKAGWLEELGLIVPDDDQYMPRQYDPWGDDGWPNGYSCYGFANYVQWYVFCQKPTDNMTGVYLGSCSFTYEDMIALGVCPGDILRIEPMYHSVVFLGYNGTEGIHTIDCNMRYYNDNANSKIRLTDLKFDSSQKVGVTAAANYTRTSEVCVREIKITSPESGIRRGEELQLSCDILPEDAVLKTVKWCVIPGTGDAFVSETGIVTGTKAGTVTIGAEALDGGGAYGKITLEILPIPAENIVITSGSEVIRGQQIELSAAFEPADCDPDPSQIVWSSSDPDTASVEGNVLTALTPGTVTVTAAYGELMDDMEITVLPLVAESVQIKGDGRAVNKESVQYSFVTYPEDTDVTPVYSVIPKTGEAMIDENGLLTAVKAGEVTVRVSLREDSGIFDEMTLEITPRYVEKIVITGDSSVIKLSETSYSAASSNNADDESVSWSVRNVDGEAFVSEDGVLTAVKPGDVILRADAKDGSGKYEEMTVKVLPLSVGSLVIEGDDSSVRRLEEITLTAKLLPEGCDFDPSLIEWSSANEKIACVENGTVKGVSTGKTTVYVTYDEDIIASREIEVTPIPAENVKISGASTVVKTEQSLYVFSVLPEEADNKEAVWSVKNGTGEASIDQKGMLTAQKAGTVIICASSVSDPDVYGEMEVTILPLKVSSVTMSGEATSVKTYRSSYSVKVLPENADDRTVTWKVIPGTGEAVVEDGILIGTKTGDITLRADANDGSGVYAEMKVEITKLSVESISIQASSSSLTYGSSMNLTGSVSPEQADVKGILWSVSDEKIAVIDENGVLTGLSVGYVTVTAASADDPSITANVRIGVTPKEVTAVRLEDLEAKAGDTLKAYVIPSDATGTFEWYADGEKIEGAEGCEYTVSFADTGKKIFARFTGNKNYTGTVDTLLTQKVQANITAEVPKAHSLGSHKDVTIRVNPDLEYLSSLRIDAACDTHFTFDLTALPEGVSLEQGSTVLTLSADWVNANLPEGDAEVIFGYLDDTVTYRAVFAVNSGILNPKTGAALKFVAPLAVLLLTVAGWLLMRKKNTKTV